MAFSAESLSTPLADYFFIAGIESSSLRATSPEHSREDRHENGTGLRPRSIASALDASRLRPQSVYSKRQSMGSMFALEQASPGSKRSSTILWASDVLGAGLSEEDFDSALRKFVAGRDSFIEDIQAPPDRVQETTQIRVTSPPPRISSPQAVHRRDKSVGSLRRRLSQATSSLNPLARSATTTRRVSNRYSKRVSGYNSVIPSPQRLQQKHDNPMKRAYEPALLDRYPRKEMVEQCEGRKTFPDYVPMFVFPNDINVVSSDERPKSKWHGWTMTGADNAKLYGMCLVLWTPLPQDCAEELDRKMDEWRQQNMSEEEREMARDLSDRLAGQRAKLSELLTLLPLYEFDSDERLALEEEISTVEERIALMADVLKPVRQGAKIDGLSEGDSGYWIPRAYGLLGRDPSLMSFYKDWLRSVTIPMAQSVLGIPISRPNSFWYPLEQYVVNILFEAPSPVSSATQVELGIRGEHRLYARKEAANEIPGSRSTDLWPLFKCLDVSDIVVLFEYVLTESRIILLSSHTSMLYSACATIQQLLFPLKWAGLFIPVLPTRLTDVLEAPTSYICGLERRAEPVQFPQGDYVVVDLDSGIIEATTPPLSMPHQIRRKLVAILQLAAPHKYRYGVAQGVPKYMEEAYPYDMFASEHPSASVFDSRAAPTQLAQLANLGSASFGKPAVTGMKPPLFNACLAAKPAPNHSPGRQSIASPSPRLYSPPSLADSACYSPAMSSQTEAPPSLQSGLREKRFGGFSRRDSSASILPLMTSRLANGAEMSRFAPPSFRRTRTSHSIAPSISSAFGAESNFGGSTYAPSSYAQSTAASTIMPNFTMQNVMNTETTVWGEGHCLELDREASATCSVCDQRAEGLYKCKGCGMHSHAGTCSESICLVCPEAFQPEQIQAAFVRCFASLFYTYLRFLLPSSPAQRSSGQPYTFKWDGFIASLPREHADYILALRETQAFNVFINEREFASANDPQIRLFDEIIKAKRNRGKTSMFSSKQSKQASSSFLADKTEHIWRTAAAPALSSRTPAPSTKGRVPAKLDQTLMRPPRALQGAPQLKKDKPRRKQVASMMGLGIRSKSEPVKMITMDDVYDKENVPPAACNVDG